MTTDVYLDKIRGSLIGGAAGDALGYPVEFMSLAEIKREFGDGGITVYQTDRETGKAVVSDDTQMTLFTGNGILVSDTMNRIPGSGCAPETFVSLAYQDWLKTQRYDFASSPKTDTPQGSGNVSWLLDVPELFKRRAPGTTCLSALNIRGRETPDDPLHHPINDSKGCGGIMRVAPVGLHYHDSDIKKTDTLGAAVAALTHGHPLGYMPAAVLTHILNRIVFPTRLTSLREIIIEAKQTVSAIFAGERGLDAMNALIDKAMDSADNDRPDTENIRLLGEGWVAEETLAIALYCALRYEHDFSGGIIAAVNHDGDSDSTGSVVGQILGAINGCGAIAEQWKTDLEIPDVITEIADDLRYGCQSENGSLFSGDWECKYLRMHRKEYKDMISLG